MFLKEKNEYITCHFLTLIKPLVSFLFGEIENYVYFHDWRPVKNSTFVNKPFCSIS
jgi:hypothetical protein